MRRTRLDVGAAFLITLLPAGLLAATTASVMFGCTSSESTASDADATAPDPRPPTPTEWDRAVTRPDETSASASRTACTFKRGALPDETLGAGTPTGKDLPIETIVVLVQENRSFDHYFSGFARYAGRSDVEVAAPDATNPERTGPASSATHVRARAGHMCFLDTNHEWDGSHLQYDDGKNDGFFESNSDFKGETMPNPESAMRTGDRALWWYDETELPFYYALAKSFGIGDHYHCSLLGPTWPNRMYLFAATSFGRAQNFFPNLDAYPFPDNDAVVLDELDKRHVDWKLYTSGGPPGVSTSLGVAIANRWNRSVNFTIDEFFADAQAGKLPPVVYVDPNFLKTGDPSGDDEHPPADIQVGQKFVSQVVNALMKSPQWGKLALFLTYDEHGGLYDHVPPPSACPPDDKTPVDGKDVPEQGAFDRYGFRVPFLVVSPYAKRGYVGHGVYDHTSILRFIQAKHRLPALTSRDANAAIPIEFFDFASPPNLTIPALPEAVVDQGELQFCEQQFAR